MLGLKRGIVKLADHDDAWASAASDSIEKLKAVLGPLLIAAEHVGSTSIRWIKAKPIIDIAVGVGDFKPVYDMIDTIEEAGFIHKRENDNEWQVFFSCGKAEDDVVTHHIHVVIFEGPEWQNYMLFRDYLNADREEALKYQRAKEELMEKHPHDRLNYTEGKSEYIRAVIEAARLKKTKEITS